MVKTAKLFVLLVGITSISCAALAQKASEPQPGKPVVIPTRYDAHRFVATPVTANNVKLSLFTDSAGGLFLYADTAERLKLSIVTLSQKEHEGVRIVGLPNFKSGAMIPPPLGSLFEMRLFVFPRRAENDHGEIDRGDGMLGQQWFAGRVWTFDYPKQVLLWIIERPYSAGEPLLEIGRAHV